MPSTNKTPNLQLNQWAGNEYVKRQDFVDDNNKIDEAYGELKREIENKASDARGTSFDNSTNGMAATNVQDAIEENKTSILNNTNLANQALNKANEAFQRGDNVKTQLVDKLISEGLEVSTNNTFEELIGNIALGKKWASGTSTTFLDTSIANYYVLDLNFNILGFIPNTVIATATWQGIYIPTVIYSKNLKDIPSGQSIFCQARNDGQNNQMFVQLLPCIEKNNVLYMYGASNNRTYNWIAFE